MLKQALILLTLFLLPAISHAVESDEAITLKLQDIQNNIQTLPLTETDPTHVDQTELKLMGRGIIAKHSKEVLGLACVGDIQGNECEILRFVHFTHLDANYIGPKFKVTNMKALKKSLKELNGHSNDRVNRGAGIIGAGMTITTVAVLLTTSLVPAGIAFAIMIALGCIPDDQFWNVVDFIQPMKNALASDSAVSVTNQNGWNWSVSPHRIRDSIFKRMMKEIKNENFMKYNTKRITPILP